MFLFLNPILAAQAAPGVADVAVAAGVIMAFFALWIFIWIAFNAIFIHVGASITGIQRTFGTAMMAVVLHVVLFIALLIVLGLISTILPIVALTGPFLPLLAMTLGIQYAYSTDFVKALITALISIVVTIIVLFVFTFVFALAVGLSLPALQKELEKYKPANLPLERGSLDVERKRGKGDARRITFALPSSSVSAARA